MNRILNRIHTWGKNSSNTGQATWLGISSASDAVLALGSAMVLSRIFNKEDYGTYKQILYIYMAMQIVFTVGLPTVFAFFIPRYSKGQNKYLVNRITWIFFAVGAVFSLTLFLSSDFIASLFRNPELATGLKIFSIFPLFTLPALGIDGIYIANRQVIFLAIFNIISRLIMLIFIVGAVLIFGSDYKNAIFGWGAASFVVFLMAMVAKYLPYKNVESEKIDNFFKTIFNYSTPLMGASMVGMLIHNANQFFISRYAGTETFAEFSNGFMPMPIVTIVSGSVAAVLLPIFSEKQSKGRKDEIKELYFNAIKRTLLIIFPVLIFCFSFAEDIMVFLYGHQYEESGRYFRVSLIRDFVEAFPFFAVILASGNTRVYFWGHFTLAITLWASLFAGVKFFNISALGIVIVFVFLHFLMCVYFFYFLYKKKDLNLFPKDILKFIFKIMIHVSACALITYLIISQVGQDMNLILKIFIEGTLFYALIFSTQRLIKVNYLEIILNYLPEKLKFKK